MSVIVFLSHTPLSSTFKVGSFHLAREFAKLDHRVVHISPPVTPLHALRLRGHDVRSRAGAMLRRRNRSMAGPIDIVPFALGPWGVLSFRGKGSSWVFVPSLQRVLAQLGVEEIDILAVDEPRFAVQVATLRYKTLVYRATDLYASMREDARIEYCERLLCASADIVIGTSRPVTSHLEAFSEGRRPVLIENGVELNRFRVIYEEPTDLSTLPRPRAIYVGATDDRFSVSDVQSAATANPSVSILLIGPLSEQAKEGLSHLRNVHLLGPRPYEEVPAYLQHCDIGLLPLSDHPANAGRSPMKIYEYAASGLLVAATETPELKRRALSFVTLYNQGHLGAAMRDLLPQLVHLDREAIRLHARDRSWSAIAEKILSMSMSGKRNG